MKKRVIALVCALAVSALALMGVGAYIKYAVLRPIGLGQDKSIVELPFLMLTDEGLRYSVQDALRKPEETEPSTEQTTESTAGVTTEATTEPTTEPATEPPTEPSIAETEPTHTHSYTVTVVAPTHTENGYTLHQCSCGASYRDNYTEKLPPEGGDETTVPTEPVETAPVVPPVYSDEYPDYDFSNGVSDSWYDKVLFIGDSRTVGLRDYARSGDAEYFCSVGMSVFNFSDRTCSDVGFSSQTLESLLSSRTYDKIFISLGINECGYPINSLINAYKDLVDLVRKYQPDAKIILQGIMAVTEKYASGKSYFQPDNINSINDRIYDIAASDSNIYYIDVNEYFTNRNGYLCSDLTADGCHLYAKYYGVWADWISYAVMRLGL